MFTVLLVVSAFPSSATSGAAEIDDALVQLARTSPDAPASALVHFDAPPREIDVSALSLRGVTTVYRFAAIPTLHVEGAARDIVALARMPGVIFVEHDAPLAYLLGQSVGEIGGRAGRAPGVVETFGITGSGVTVAVVDSGVDATHTDLPYGAKVLANVKMPLTGPSVPDTDYASGHGTHVAGIVAGTGEAGDGRHTGVAPGASIVGVGSGEALSVAFASQGLDWTWKNVELYGIKIATNSWGSVGGGNYNANGAVERLIKQLHDKNVVVLFAVGNDGTTTTGTKQWEKDTLSGYAMSPYAIGVASYNSRVGVVSDFSSRGDASKASFAAKLGTQRRPDIAAPGEQVLSAAALTGGAASLTPRVPGVVEYVRMSGTSMATPHVAGAAALVIEAFESRGCSWSPTDVQQALYRTARAGLLRNSEGNIAGAHEQGRGAVDAYAAVELVMTAPTCSVNTAPLPVAYPSYVALVIGDLHVYQGGRADPFGIVTTGSDADRTLVFAGEPVSIASRSTRSVDVNFPVDASTQGSFLIYRADDETTVVATLPITSGGAENLGLSGFSFDWNSGRALPHGIEVPVYGTANPSLPAVFPLLPSGDYVLKARLDVNGGVFVADELPLRVIGVA